MDTVLKDGLCSSSVSNIQRAAIICSGIPFEEIAQLKAHILNVGPFGKDVHQKTERFRIDSAFEEIPVMLDTLIKSMLAVNDNLVTITD